MTPMQVRQYRSGRLLGFMRVPEVPDVRDIYRASLPITMKDEYLSGPTSMPGQSAKMEMVSFRCEEFIQEGCERIRVLTCNPSHEGMLHLLPHFTANPNYYPQAVARTLRPKKEKSRIGLELEELGKIRIPDEYPYQSQIQAFFDSRNQEKIEDYLELL
jgi:hypothetical protein